ncbi:hypothetical protein HDR70_02095 [bacterium]|nr:hypothetical protein [Bacteroides sp.]MBD5386664.1 hypothetical protein [bacterium]
MAVKDKSLLHSLDEFPQQVLLTNRLQVADILEHILDWTGPADLWQTTFSVSEEFLRRMFYIRQRGKIISANVILDYKGGQKTLKLWHFIESVFDSSFMADNHSKIILAKGRSSGRVVSVITSQNLTRGNRFESSILTTERDIFSSLLKEWEEIAGRKSIPLDELLRSAADNHSEIGFGLPHGI